VSMYWRWLASITCAAAARNASHRVVHKLAAASTQRLNVAIAVITFALGFASSAHAADPTVDTDTASDVSATVATLRASANPRNNAATTGWFRYATTSPGTCNDTFGTRTDSVSLGAGSATVAFEKQISGLTPGTVYYYCPIVRSGTITVFGLVYPFSTHDAPTVTTRSATSVTTTGATLQGLANPQGSHTNAWFRYSTTNPGTCNDSFGTRVANPAGEAQGAGTQVTQFAAPLTSLTTGTTYYYCAIANNSIGKGFGAIVAFSTLGPPTVSTLEATAVSSSGATLQGSGIPRGSATSGWFRYGTDGSCSDNAGARAPSANGVSLGTGIAPVTYSQQIGGLRPKTLYQYCAFASNTYGVRTGTPINFTTHGAPSVRVRDATAVSSTSATLPAIVTPYGSPTTAWFRYSTTHPGACNDSFGTRAPSSGGMALGAGFSEVSYSQSLAGLARSTTYYSCAITSNALGTTVSSVVAFTTLAGALVTTTAAVDVTSTSAVLQARAGSEGSETNVWFRFSATQPARCDDDFGTRLPASGSVPPDSGAPGSFSQQVSDLSPGATYYYCAIGINAKGIGFGSVNSVTPTVPSAPSVNTAGANDVYATSATIVGQANPNGISTLGWFRYSTDDPETCNDSFGIRVPADGGFSLGGASDPVQFSQSFQGLFPGTTYYYCAIAGNASGIGVGRLISLQLPSAPSTAPAVATLAATNIEPNGATLQGTANSNSAPATAWFRYDTTSPGVCNDSFGTRAPNTGGEWLSGYGGYSQVLSGLQPDTTYYYCAVAGNTYGTRMGSVRSFKTPVPIPPVIATEVTTELGTTFAVLRGSANRRSSRGVGWFRYDTTNPGNCSDSFGTRVPSSSDIPLGSGSSATTFAEAIMDLLPNTTYYHCALARNDFGTSTGSVVSFTTLPIPVEVGTEAATNIARNGAMLHASANPQGSDSFGWFRYGTTEPIVCHDDFGTRTPSSPGVSLGAVSTPVSYTQPLTDLATGTTYFYCALASNASGVSVGSVLSFTTPSAPYVVSGWPIDVSTTSVRVRGYAVSDGQPPAVWFRYSTTNPGMCNDTFGARAPTSGGSSLGDEIFEYREQFTGLMPSTTYYYCVLANNEVGITAGQVLSFTTLVVPAVTTASAAAVTTTTALLHASANPRGSSTVAWFRYGTSPGACSDNAGSSSPVYVGSGTTALDYSQQVYGLTPNTTYYYCALASSSAGESLGAVLSFSTSAEAQPPDVTSDPATSISSNTATLYAMADPKGFDTIGWFRYSTTSPGACNDSFGARAPSSAGTTLGAGTTPASYAQILSGLLPATTYYYCALAANVAGTSTGSLLTFATLPTPVTPPDPPSVTTDSATDIAPSAAKLAGSVNPNLVDALGWFRYSTINPGICNDSFGTREPSSAGTTLSAGSTPVAYSQLLNGLLPDTTYYYCAIASNVAGTSVGSMLSFTTMPTPVTPPEAPAVSTYPATDITSSAATLLGAATPNLVDANGWFRYSTTNPGACSDSFGARVPSSNGAPLGVGSTPVSYALTISELRPDTTYYYCALAGNFGGIGAGPVLSFRTMLEPVAPPERPVVATELASGIASTAATLRASANPNLSETEGWFRYSVVEPSACSDDFGTRVPSSAGTSLAAGSATTAYAEELSALMPETTYYYCAIARNASGTSFGTVMSLTTSADPVAITEQAHRIASTSVTLSGSVSTAVSATVAWFRFGSTNPGTCSDSFGTRVPASGGAKVPATGSPAHYEEQLGGLSPGSTYYYCAIAVNEAGTGVGAVETWTTSADAPTVVSAAATDVTQESAVLTAAAKPNGAATTGWFRYATSAVDACDDDFGVRSSESGDLAIGDGQTARYSQEITGLLPAAVYYFCAIARNERGTTFGDVLSFSSSAVAPDVTTDSPTDVTQTSARLAVTVVPNGTDTTVWFRVSDSSVECNDDLGERAPATGGGELEGAYEPVAFTYVVTELEPNATYYSCAVARNQGGLTFGSSRAFTTAAAPPVVTTTAPRVSEAGQVTLRGSGNARGSATTGRFRYSTTEPNRCDDEFGTLLAPDGGTSLGDGRAAVEFSAVSTLPPGTYYACAIASNEAGAGFGALVRFQIADKAKREEGGCGFASRSSTSNDAAAYILGLLWVLSRRRGRQPSSRAA
jgi:hypothetical protein